MIHLATHNAGAAWTGVRQHRWSRNWLRAGVTTATWVRNCVTAKAFANVAGRVYNLELEGARPVFGGDSGLY